MLPPPAVSPVRLSHATTSSRLRHITIVSPFRCHRGEKSRRRGSRRVASADDASASSFRRHSRALTKRARFDRHISSGSSTLYTRPAAIAASDQPRHRCMPYRTRHTHVVGVTSIAGSEASALYGRRPRICHHPAARSKMATPRKHSPDDSGDCYCDAANMSPAL